MDNSIIVEGKTSNEAIQKGLKQLKCRIEDVDVKILDNPDKKIFFSILDPRVVKVQLTLKNKKEDRARNNGNDEPSKEDFDAFVANIKCFLDRFCELYGNITYDVDIKNGFVCVNIKGDDSSKLIGYRGDVINSIQNILSSIGNKDNKNRVKVIVDICNYKEKREKTLIELSKKIEKNVIRSRKKYVLDPMNAYDRKVIHNALQNSEKVTTYSIGEEPYRKVVVDIKK